MINQEDYAMIAEYDLMGVDERRNIIETKGFQVIKLIPQIYCEVNFTSKHLLSFLDIDWRNF